MSKTAKSIPDGAFFTLETVEIENSNPAIPTENTAKLAPKGAFLVSSKKTGVKTGVNDFGSPASYRKRFMSKYKPYKLPKLMRCKSGDWYVEYFFERPDAPGKFKSFKVRDGINYIHDPEEKEKEAKKLVKEVRFALEVDNYNPFDEKKTLIVDAKAEVIKVTERQRTKFWTVKEANAAYLAYIKWKNLAKTTIDMCESYMNGLDAWLIKKGMTSFEMAEFTEAMLLEYLDSKKSSNQQAFSARTYNNYLTFFRTYFTRIEKLERKSGHKVKYEMDLSDLELKKSKAERNRYYSDTIAVKVKEKLTSDLRDYCEWIYHSCMRPREIQLLQVQHIDLSSRQIKVAGETGKTGDRFVPVSEELLRLINDRKLTEVPANYYVFGSEGKPGPKHVYEMYFSRRYRKVREALGLDDNYTIYGWKHTAVVNMIHAGFSHEEIMIRTGHRDRKSFEAYIRDLVVEPNSRMTGKTIPF